jgi:hypothetical protein
MLVAEALIDLHVLVWWRRRDARANSALCPDRDGGSGLRGMLAFSSPPNEGEPIRLLVRAAFAPGSHPKGAPKNLTLVRMRIRKRCLLSQYMEETVWPHRHGSCSSHGGQTAVRLTSTKETSNQQTPTRYPQNISRIRQRREPDVSFTTSLLPARLTFNR